MTKTFFSVSFRKANMKVVYTLFAILLLANFNEAFLPSSAVAYR